MTSFSFGTIAITFFQSYTFFIYISSHTSDYIYNSGDRYRDYLIFITSALIICELIFRYIIINIAYIGKFLWHCYKTLKE